MRAEIVTKRFVKRRIAVAVVSVVILVTAVAIYVYNYDECEVIELGPPLVWGSDDRESPVVVVDRSVLSLEATKSLALSLASSTSVRSVTFCESAPRRLPGSITSSVLFLFGRNASSLANLSPDPATVYVVLPTVDPPDQRVNVVVAVMLTAKEQGAKTNAAWRQWCEKHRVPFIERDTGTAEDVKEGLLELNKRLNRGSGNRPRL